MSFDMFFTGWTRLRCLTIAVVAVLGFGLATAIPATATAHEDQSDVVAIPALVTQPDYQSAIYQLRGTWHGTKIFMDGRRESTSVTFKCTASGIDGIGTLLTNNHCGNSPQHGEQILRNGGLDYGVKSGTDSLPASATAPTHDPNSAAPAMSPDAFVLTDLVLAMEYRTSPFDRKAYNNGTPYYNDPTDDDEGYKPLYPLTSGTLSSLDLALFRIPNARNTPFLELSETKPQVNDNVHVAGYPADDLSLTTTSAPSAGSQFQVTSTDGTVNRYTYNGLDLFETDARILPGQSGSPVMDRITHTVDGIVTRGPDPAQFGFQSNIVTYVINVDVVRDFLQAHGIVQSKFDVALQQQDETHTTGIQRLNDESTYIPWWFIALLLVLLFLAFLAFLFRELIRTWFRQHSQRRQQSQAASAAPVVTPVQPVVLHCPYAQYEQPGDRIGSH